MPQSARMRDPIPELKRQAGAELAVLVEGWNADDVAVLLGTDRPRISELRRGKLDRFSLETLIRYLTRLRRTVELRIAPPTHR
jgi:predicted XRE-type DNA-binding protein